MTEAIASIRDRVTGYYGAQFGAKLTADYVAGNARIVAAIRFVLDRLPVGATRVLDIGCGIAWSSHEIAERLPGARVLGVDINQRSLEVGRRLFPHPRVELREQDLWAWTDTPDERFDAIVMIDVYEHMPPEQRGELHALFDRLLKKDAAVLLTCPSPSHQAYLRRYEPEGLQPVDEDIDEPVAEAMASDLGGRVAAFEAKTIWRAGDYNHIAVERGAPSKRAGRPPFEPPPIAERAKRVAERLGVRVLNARCAAPVRPGPAVCVVSHEIDEPSQTFVRNHIARLPMAVRVLTRPGYDLTDDYRDLGVSTRRERWEYRLRHRRRHISKREMYIDRVSRFFAEADVRAVLAEFGPTGVAMMDVCDAAGVPLVVHFHGYDATQTATLDEFRNTYPALLEQAAAVVAVSNDMRAQLVAMGAAESKVHVISCGVDAEAFSGARPAEAPPRFVAVGRFIEKKAPHLVVLALARVLAARPEARLVMAGDGPLMPVVAQMVDAMGLGGAVELVGAVPHERVMELMRGARCLVQHSVRASDGDCEGSPVSVVEAGATGLPVVATRHAGIKEAVIDGRTGLLVDERDVAGMAAAMIRMVDEPATAAAMGAAGRAHVAANYSMSGQLLKLARVIHEASGGAIPIVDSGGGERSSE